MIRKGVSGGLLSIISLLDKESRVAMGENSMVKLSSAMKKEAAKIGLQSLYANADEVLEKYKDFDIIKAMKARKDSNLLWVRARAIDADVINSNGDYFSEEELTKKIKYKDKNIPAYKTFEGVPIFTNHKNDNVEEAKGMVVYAEWDEEEKCVYCVFFVDEDAYPDIARGIRQGYIHDVSMGCSVDEGICSICENKATTEKDYCDCLRRYKGKMHPSGKRAFEYNYGIKFIELSCVGDGAFELCEIEEIYDQEELLEKAQKAVKTAQSLNSSITLAASIHDDLSDRKEIESFLRNLNYYNTTAIKVAQTAGTLVGGQLMGGAGSQNATVVKILQGLGIDPSSSLNILDLVNLSLNFLEVAVLNLFSRKDNIDLTHVAKLTKAMGELQDTLQDMIDDGVETGQQRNTQPIIPPQQGAGQAPQMGAQQPAAPAQPPQGGQVPPIQTQQSLFTQPSVGAIISPFDQQPMVLPLGGGVTAKNKTNTRFVWASTHENEEIEIVETKQKINKIGKFILALDNLREACEIPIKNNNEEITIKPQKDKITASSSGDKKIMDHFKKIAQDIKKANTVAVTMDIKLDDQSGNRIVLSTDQGIKGFYKGRLTNWSPNLNDSQLHQMENGDGYKVAADLLKDFSSIVKTAEQEKKVDYLLVMDEYISPERTEEHAFAPEDILNDHKGKPYEGFEEKLDSRRTGDNYMEVLNEKLEPHRTKELVRIVTELYNDVKRGKYGDETLEQLLHPNFGRSVLPGKEVMSNVVKGIVRTCQKTKSKPEDVIKFLTNVPKKDFAKLICVAKLGTSVREYDYVMNKFAQTELSDEKDSMSSGPSGDMQDSDDEGMSMDSKTIPDMGAESFKDIADTASPETSEGDILKALEVIKENFEQAVEKLNEILNKDKSGTDSPETNDDEDMKDALSEDDDTDQEALKGAVTGLSLSGEETGAKPEAIVDTVNDMPIDDVVKNVDEARMPSNALARVKNKSIKQASKDNLKSNIIGWLADIANHNNIPTNKIALAAKLFCSYGDAATKVLEKSIKTSEVKVIDETTHSTIINATLEDIGCDIKDASFNERFRDFAVQLLGKSGYEVDPTTFALTEITVDENGLVCGRVSTRATKTFIPEDEPEDNFDLSGDYHDPDRAEKMITAPSEAGNIPVEVVTPVPANEPVSMVMSDSSKTAKRLARIKNVIKIAQGLGLPGSPGGGGVGAGQGMMGGGPGGAAAPGGVDPLGGAGMAGGAGDLGFGAFTSGSMGEGSINESPEPGNKSPWGTICPQCGSKDVDIANGEGKCNSCNAQLKYKFIVEVSPDESSQSGAGMNPPTPPEAINPAAAPLPPTGGPLGAPEVGGGGLAGTPPTATPGAPAMASDNSMRRLASTSISYRTSAEVYANANSEGFNKDLVLKLPVGMICPSCGSRTASKNKKTTYCYDCGTMSVSEIKRVPGKPGLLEANIVWF
jgi:hypothetical protein